MNRLPRWFKTTLYVIADFTAILAIGFFIYFARADQSNAQEYFVGLAAYALVIIFLLFLTRIYAMITLHFGLIDSIKIGLITVIFNLAFFIFLELINLRYTALEVAFVM
ncbi:MAG: hypothetical protein ACO3H6_04645, partial [Bacilli bacterium]